MELNQTINLKVNICIIMQSHIITKRRLYPAELSFYGWLQQANTPKGFSRRPLSWQFPSWFLLLCKWPCFAQHLMKALLKAALRLVQAFKPSEKRSQLQGTCLPLRQDSIYYHFPLPIHFKGIFATLCPVLIQEYLSFKQHRWLLGQLTENSCFTANPTVAVPVSWLECNNTNSSVVRT